MTSARKRLRDRAVVKASVDCSDERPIAGFSTGSFARSDSYTNRALFSMLRFAELLVASRIMPVTHELGATSQTEADLDQLWGVRGADPFDPFPW